jgi:superfamily II DNA/RNA helicase
LSPEFQIVIDEILTYFPPTRQILLFSATFPMVVKTFKDKHLDKPYEINLMDTLTLKGITQYYAYVEERQKVHCLNTLFSKVLIILKILIICGSCKSISRSFFVTRRAESNYLHAKSRNWDTRAFISTRKCSKPIETGCFMTLGAERLVISSVRVCDIMKLTRFD